MYQEQAKTPKLPLHPKHPERICWGCDKFCPADDMRCGNGTIRAPHPAELFGDDWDAVGTSAQVDESGRRIVVPSENRC